MGRSQNVLAVQNTASTNNLPRSSFHLHKKCIHQLQLGTFILNARTCSYAQLRPATETHTRPHFRHSRSDHIFQELIRKLIKHKQKRSLTLALLVQSS